MKNSLIVVTISLLLFAGCKKEKTTPNIPDTAAGVSRIFILNQGSWGSNSGEISVADPTTGSITNAWFATANGRGLGDVAQDMIHYGGKLYVAVSYSHTVEVIDPATGHSLRQISFANRTPRYLACHDGKVYVSCYDKTIARIDTTSLTIDGKCTLSGMQPEQICILGGKLYVCNSWQYGEGSNIVYDSTLSVVDLATFTETGKLTIAVNPTQIQPLDNHRLVITCEGNYASASATTLIYDISTHRFQPLPMALSCFDIYQGNIYGYAVHYDASWNPSVDFYCIDGTSLVATPILTSYNKTITYAYGINIDTSNGTIYICNSPYTMNGDVWCFSLSGTKQWHVEAGLMTSKIVF